MQNPKTQWLGDMTRNKAQNDVERMAVYVNELRLLARQEFDAPTAGRIYELAEKLSWTADKLRGAGGDELVRIDLGTTRNKAMAS